VRRVVGVAAAFALAVLVGCAPAPPEGTPFERALTRVDGPFAGRVEFMDARGLATAAAGGGPWAELVGATGGSLDSYRGALADVLDIDLSRADTVLAAGNPPQRVTLVAGGQDEARVRAAATAAGWTGDGELRLGLTPAQPLSLVAGTLRPLGSDVAVGGPDAAVDVVDGPGPTLADDDAVDAVTSCLGHVLVAVVASGAAPGEPLRGVGLRRDPAVADAPPINVLCAVGDGATAVAISEAMRLGRSARTGLPYSEYLSDPHVEELGGDPPVVRMVARTAAGGPTTFLLQALEVGDLPGLGE
jgi:hypothetical protein